jgi:transcriptional regulator
MDEKQFQSINKKLDVLIGLLAMNLTKDKTLQERVELLNSLGLGQKEIAKSLGKSERNISTNLLRIRKQQRNKK